MLTTHSSTQLLEELPRVALGRVTLHVVTANGEIHRRAGGDDGTVVRNRAQGLVVEPGAGRSVFQQPLSDGEVAILSFDSEEEEAVTSFLRCFFDLSEQKRVLEADMESIQPSSLALLEEVSMYNDTLPQLSAGSSADEVAEMGLQALVVAASLNRAVYLRYDQTADRCEVLVQVGVDETGRRAEREPFSGNPVALPDDGIVWEAIRGSGAAILREVPEGERLGAFGSAESLAERELIAVPVSYGSEEKRVTLGVLLVMDKRANAYSNSESLGSQETKFATAVASMMGSVLGARKVAELGKELNLAQDIQREILPQAPAIVQGFDLAGRCSTSGAVGGDYFDFLPMRDGRTLVVVADVSGHNLASGMLMVGARATLRALTSKQDSPKVVFDDLADALYEDLTRTERFITIAAATLTEGGSRVEIVNAGHNDTMIYRAEKGEIERISSDAPILGFMPGARHGQHNTNLLPGDVMLLYTDGVVEATNSDGEMLGDARLGEMLADVASGSAEQILQAVFEAVESFADAAMPGDDVTAVVVKALPSGGSEA